MGDVTTLYKVLTEEEVTVGHIQLYSAPTKGDRILFLNKPAGQQVWTAEKIVQRTVYVKPKKESTA